MVTKREYYLLVDYISWRGGTYNVQRARIVPVGMAPGFIKQFHSEIDKAESRAKSWCKKNNITLV